jgi:hypothetical protein
MNWRLQALQLDSCLQALQETHADLSILSPDLAARQSRRRTFRAIADPPDSLAAARPCRRPCERLVGTTLHGRDAAFVERRSATF